MTSSPPIPGACGFLEIRGTAEALGDGADGGPLIRIRPTRILSFGVEQPPGEPHQTRMQARDLVS
jgi:pyridoxamine 5'-phosphate oxidase family protein